MEPVPAAQLRTGEAVLEDRPAVVAAQRVLRADLVQHLVVRHHPVLHPRPPLLRRRLRSSASPSIDGADAQLPDLPAQRVASALSTTAASGRARSTRTPASWARLRRSARERRVEVGAGTRRPGSSRRRAAPAGVVGADHHRDQLAACGRRPRAIWPGRSAIRAPVTRVVPAALAAAAAPEQPLRRGCRTAVSVPVAQDTSGQSESTVQASKPRVMESPTAASESGLRVPDGGGGRLRPAARPGRAGRVAPAASQPSAAAGPCEGRRRDASDGDARRRPARRSAGIPTIVPLRTLGVLAGESSVRTGSGTDGTSPLGPRRTVAFPRSNQSCTWPIGSSKLHHVTCCPFCGVYA